MIFVQTKFKKKKCKKKYDKRKQAKFLNQLSWFLTFFLAEFLSFNRIKSKFQGSFSSKQIVINIRFLHQKK